MVSTAAVLVALGFSGCTDREADPRQVEDAVEEALQRDTTVQHLEARVDSLERALAAILAQAGNEPMAPATNEEAPATRAPQRPDTAPPEADVWPEDLRYETYQNARLGYSLDYPANVFSRSQSLDGGKGHRFDSRGGGATLAVYGVDNVSPQALRNLYQAELQDPNQRVTYKTVHDDWFVLSGYRGDKIFYERTLLRNGILKTFLLLYDASLKSYFDPITERISFSFEG